VGREFHRGVFGSVDTIIPLYLVKIAATGGLHGHGAEVAENSATGTLIADDETKQPFGWCCSLVLYVALCGLTCAIRIS